MSKPIIFKTKIAFNGYMTVDEFMEFFGKAVGSAINRYHQTEDQKYHIEDLAVSASLAADAVLSTIEAIPWEITKKN